MGLEASKVFKEIAKEIANQLIKEFPEISGISLCGSIALGNSDEFSDIDLDVWLPNNVYKKWSEKCPLMDFFKEYSINRETPTNFSFCVKEKYKIDMALLSVEEMLSKEWKVEQKADRKYSQILYDKNDSIKALLTTKLKSSKGIFNSKEEYSIYDPSPSYYKFYISAYLNYHVPVALARNRIEQAHFLINQAVHYLINLLWIEKEDFYPYDKSKWLVIDNHLNDEQKGLIKESMKIIDFSEEDVKRRRKSLRELYKRLGYEEISFYHEKIDLS